jgi:hypothetical protein
VEGGEEKGDREGRRDVKREIERGGGMSKGKNLEVYNDVVRAVDWLIGTLFRPTHTNSSLSSSSSLFFSDSFYLGNVYCWKDNHMQGCCCLGSWKATFD